MQASTLILILNLVLVGFIVLGFLFGLKGVKKAGLSLGFFVVSLVASLLITPLISKLILNIQIDNNGTTMPISQIILEYVKQIPVISQYAISGSNFEALVNNIPQVVGNLVVFIALVYVVGLLFWIAYLITAHFIFKKNKSKNQISKTAPSTVTATGSIKYEKEEKPERKFRLLGGLVGGAHGLILLIATLIPVVGAVNIVNSIATQTEASETVIQMTTLDVAQTGSGEQSSNSNSTPFAKLLNANLPPQVLEITSAVGNSVIGNVCSVVDFNDIWFNSIAKCKVNGEKIVLKKEIVNLANIYNNVEFLKNINFSDTEQIKNIDFDKIRTAINYVFNSGVLKSVAPEVISKTLDWATTTDITSLDVSTQKIVRPMNEFLESQPHVKEYIEEVKKMFSNENTIVDTLKKEVLNLVDLSEIIVKSDLADYIVNATETVKASDVIAVLHKDNDKLINDIVDKLFTSDLINKGTLVALNYGIDYLENSLNGMLSTADQIDLKNIVLATAQNRFDASSLKTMISLAFDVYTEYDYIGFENIQNDITLLNTSNFSNNIKKVGKFLDQIKDMKILQEYDVYTDVINALNKLTFGEGEGTIKLSNYIDLSSTKAISYSYETDFGNIADSLKLMLFKTHEVEENGEMKSYSLAMFIANGNIDAVTSTLTSTEIGTITKQLASSKLFKPLSIKLVNELNKRVTNAIGGEYTDLLPENVEITEEEAQQIADVIEDAVDLIPDLTNLQNGTVTISEIIQDQTKQGEVVALLESLEANATSEGILSGLYGTMTNYIKDESNGLTGIGQIISNNTTTSEGIGDVDWDQVMKDYVASLS